MIDPTRLTREQARLVRKLAEKRRHAVRYTRRLANKKEC